MSDSVELKYKDIINQPHHVSVSHPQMTISNRAAQFMPFAALTGYDAAINETARLTDEKMDLEEDTRMSINEALQRLSQHEGTNREARVTFFKPDMLKDGGTYLTSEGSIKKIDLSERQIIFQDGQMIRIDDIIDIQELEN